MKILKIKSIVIALAIIGNAQISHADFEVASADLQNANCLIKISDNLNCVDDRNWQSHQPTTTCKLDFLVKQNDNTVQFRTAEAYYRKTNIHQENALVGIIHFFSIGFSDGITDIYDVSVANSGSKKLIETIKAKINLLPLCK